MRELIIRRMRLEDLHPAPWNPRKPLDPSTPMWEHLKDSIEDFGMVEPIVWNERTGNMVSGHRRYDALLAQGEEETDVSVVDLSEHDEMVLGILLNKAKGRWDPEKLIPLLEELKAAGLMEKAGFEEWELEALQTTYDHINDLLEEDFAERDRELTSFTMTFTLPKSFQEAWEQYEESHPDAKAELTLAIVNRARGVN